MEKKQEPRILDGIINTLEVLLKSGSNHGVNASNIGDLIDTIGDHLIKYQGTAPAASQTEVLTAKPTAIPDHAQSTTASDELPTSTKRDKAASKVPSTEATATTTPRKRGRKPKQPTIEAAPPPQSEVPSTPTEAPAKRRGRKPKAAAAPTISEQAPATVATAPEAQETQQPVKRGRGRPKKIKPAEEAQATLALSETTASPETELSDDPKAPNYRFKNLLKNGKAVTWKGMKPSEAINGEEVTCMICGQTRLMLKKHLTQAHNMTGEQYLRHFGLDPADEKNQDFLRGPDFANRKSAETKASGFGKHERKKAPAVVASKATPKSSETKKGRGRVKAIA